MKLTRIDCYRDDAYVVITIAGTDDDGAPVLRRLYLNPTRAAHLCDQLRQALDGQPATHPPGQD